LLVLDAHRDDVDAAGEPRLHDLVLLRGIGLRGPVPEQLDPQLLRGLLGARPAAREVGIALVLRHHGDRRRLVLAGPARGHAQHHRHQGRHRNANPHARLPLSKKRFAPSAARSRTAVTTPASSAGRSARRRPFWRTASAARPSSVPPTVPRPPKIDVPPRTTAVIAISSKP